MLDFDVTFGESQTLNAQLDGLIFINGTNIYVRDDIIDIGKTTTTVPANVATDEVISVNAYQGYNNIDINWSVLSGVVTATVNSAASSVITVKVIWLHTESLNTGDISDNAITNTKLGTDVKVGSLANLTTSNKSNIVSAINEINAKLT